MKVKVEKERGYEAHSLLHCLDNIYKPRVCKAESCIWSQNDAEDTVPKLKWIEIREYERRNLRRKH